LQFEARLFALVQPDQTGFQRRGQLTTAKLEGRRFVVESVDDSAIDGPIRDQGNTVVKRQERIGQNDGCGLHHQKLEPRHCYSSIILSDQDPAVPIRDWPEQERPREKLIAQGAASLTDAELLAVLLHTGRSGQSAVELAREALLRFGSLSGVFGASFEEFASMKGFGPAKYAQVQAVLEVTKRTLGETLRQGVALSSPGAVRDYLCLELGRKPYEVFFALFLDSRNRLLEARELFRGTLGETSVYPREVVKAALAANAAAVVFAHNHPSGIAEPTVADDVLTDNLTAALAMVDIRALDHFIVAGNQIYSFAEHGRLRPRRPI
jgi:DNA repair protein RadC